MGGLMGGTTDLVPLSIAIFLPICSEIRYLENMALFESWCTYLKLFTVIIFLRHYAILAFCVNSNYAHLAIWLKTNCTNGKWVLHVIPYSTRFSSSVTVSFHSWNVCPKIHPTSCSSGYIWVKRSDVRGYRY